MHFIWGVNVFFGLHKITLIIQLMADNPQFHDLLAMGDSWKDYSEAKHVSNIMKDHSWKRGQMQRPGQNSSSFLTFIRAATVQSGADSWRWYSRYRWSEHCSTALHFSDLALFMSFIKMSWKVPRYHFTHAKRRDLYSSVHLHFCSGCFAKSKGSWLRDVKVCLAHCA